MDETKERALFYRKITGDPKRKIILFMELDVPKGSPVWTVVVQVYTPFLKTKEPFKVVVHFDRLTATDPITGYPIYMEK